MRWLLLIPAFTLPVLLYSCHSKPPEPAVVIQRDHAAFPAVPVPAVKPEAPKVSPRPHKVTPRKPVHHKRPKPTFQKTQTLPCPIVNLPCPWRTN